MQGKKTKSQVTQAVGRTLLHLGGGLVGATLVMWAWLSRKQHVLTNQQ
jgi:hypothetical protein